MQIYLEVKIIIKQLKILYNKIKIYKMIYIISVLLERCPACIRFKNEYWNNIDEDWQNKLIKKNGFIPITWEFPLDKNSENYILLNNIFKEKNINYINTFPFIFAVKDNNFNVKNIKVFCADYDDSVNKFIYREGQKPLCRNRTNFENWLLEIKKNNW